jgi:hypothetical protein
MTNATQASSIDDEVGNLEKDLADLLGIPIDTDVMAAMFIVAAQGLSAVQFQDSGTDPQLAGQLLRYGAALKYHTGAEVKNISDPFAGLATLALTTSLVLGDAAADPTLVGTLQRNGIRLMYHDGTQPIELHGFPAGTQMVFHLNTAPPGWVRRVEPSLTDSMVRLLLNNEGPMSSGGSWISHTDFHALTFGQMPGHQHDMAGSFAPVSTTGGNSVLWHSSQSGSSVATGVAGSGEGHQHALSGGGTWRPKYVDFIVAIKQ